MPRSDNLLNSAYCIVGRLWDIKKNVRFETNRLICSGDTGSSKSPYTVICAISLTTLHLVACL